ncbi:unnamed protein product, partial [Symbiodinium pilosum]
RNLIKCSPEQLRFASDREHLLETLAKEHGHDSTPWTFNRVAAEIGGSQFQDISADIPSEAEWSRAQDVLQEIPPVRFRFRGKRAQPEPLEIPEEPETGGATSSRNEAWYMARTENPLAGQIKGERWFDHVPESAWFTSTSEYWTDKAAAVEIEVTLPESRQGLESASRNLEAFFTGALKRRAVEDEAYEHPATSAPVMTKQTRQLFLQLAANSKWSVSKGDITGAFLQGKELTETLYCIPTDEICTALKIPTGSVTRLRRAAYGLVQAPLQWYLTIAEFLEEIGLERLRSDPCAWVWRPEKTGKPRAMVVGHVDDFLFAGSDHDTGHQEPLKPKPQSMVKTAYTL